MSVQWKMLLSLLIAGLLFKTSFTSALEILESVLKNYKMFLQLFWKYYSHCVKCPTNVLFSVGPWFDFFIAAVAVTILHSLPYLKKFLHL